MEPRDDVLLAAPKVEIDLLAIAIVENDDRFPIGTPECLQYSRRDLGRWTGGELPVAGEGRETLQSYLNHWRNSD